MRHAEEEAARAQEAIRDRERELQQLEEQRQREVCVQGVGRGLRGVQDLCRRSVCLCRSYPRHRCASAAHVGRRHPRARCHALKP